MIQNQFVHDLRDSCLHILYMDEYRRSRWIIQRPAFLGSDSASRLLHSILDETVCTAYGFSDSLLQLAEETFIR
jgi:hypothetical protein